MFEEPAKRDIDAALSVLMNEARRQVQDAKNRVTSDAIKQGAARSNRVIIAIADDADKVHKASIDQGKKILLDFIERMQLPRHRDHGMGAPSPRKSRQCRYQHHTAERRSQRSPAHWDTIHEDGTVSRQAGEASVIRRS
ncbi:hypothetical protein [Labrys monachus]|uniref:Uncharacterized protein n=1 Tax=Labrys monachus TaxID=217067 RepID=A0ABU0FPK4_9HYPH|nr:hypothetical protein [Labrys monachus]MDQ0396471.1 hypothetical protein [Labrys monachus]